LKRIHRVRIGCVEVQGLPAGGYRMLSRKEISWFFNHGPGEADGRSD
jgi:16S rRNA U516 pseudouridylate synthase RsuA-like enzyme